MNYTVQMGKVSFKTDPRPRHFDHRFQILAVWLRLFSEFSDSQTPYLRNEQTKDQPSLLETTNLTRFKNNSQTRTHLLPAESEPFSYSSDFKKYITIPGQNPGQRKKYIFHIFVRKISRTKIFQPPVQKGCLYDVNTPLIPKFQSKLGEDFDYFQSFR